MVPEPCTGIRRAAPCPYGDGGGKHELLKMRGRHDSGPGRHVSLLSLPRCWVPSHP